ncbi:hypothetical protein O9G_002334 [Rozella allomycis CSF55]|uniref:AIG1-type G domain-containing protein n=1 Tax=Rozella allomycis (strain CSF55) TaxID=988480 RepID=A0A075B541_ROZAC|nr:hypothetical protein O9G_002334 [Rozella allomycis CSF55]|eukprot:EPZ36723.1 hypothetical protein O9G_002334 [Rozella allomycis CSF55]
MVNVLHGLFDLMPNDNREVAKSSNSMDSVTTECKGYDCSIDGVNLHVVDTPGFEDDEAKNNEVATLIAEKVPTLLKDGIDAFFFLYPVDRACKSQLANVFNFMTSLITKEGFKQGFIVFTKADSVVTEEDEQKKIEELKGKFMAVAPQAKEFLDTVKYLFYRHWVAFGGSRPMSHAEARKAFAVKAYSEIVKKCVENNGKTFSTDAMIKAKAAYERMNQEIETYRQAREKFVLDFQKITTRSTTLPEDLNSMMLEIKEIGLKELNTTDSTTREDLLNNEKKFATENENLKKQIDKYLILETEIDNFAKNITSLKEESTNLLNSYNEAKDKFMTMLNSCQGVDAKYQYDVFDVQNINKDFNWIPLFGLHRRDIEDSIRSSLGDNQHLFDKAFKDYREAKMNESGINNDKFSVPVLDVSLPTLNQYTSYSQKLTKFNQSVKRRTGELLAKTSNFKYFDLYVRDYSQKDSLKEAIIRQNSILTPYLMRQMDSMCLVRCLKA